MKRELLIGHDEAVAKFVAQFAPVERPEWRAPYWAFGVLKENGSLVAGAVFSDWKPDFKTLEFSGAVISSHGVSTQIVTAIGGFVFGELQAYRLFARTEVKNRRAEKLLRHLGFTQEAVQGHHYGPGRHASCWRLIRPEWERKWAPEAQQAA